MQEQRIENFLKLQSLFKREALGELTFLEMVNLTCRRNYAEIKTAFKFATFYGKMLAVFAVWVLATLIAHDIQIVIAYSLYFCGLHVVYHFAHQVKYLRTMLIERNFRKSKKLWKNDVDDELLKIRYFHAEDVATEAGVIEVERKANDPIFNGSEQETTVDH